MSFSAVRAEAESADDMSDGPVDSAEIVLSEDDSPTKNIKEIVRRCKQEPSLVVAPVVYKFDSTTIRTRPLVYLIRKGASLNIIRAFLERHWEFVQEAHPQFSRELDPLRIVCESAPKATPGLVAYLVRKFPPATCEGYHLLESLLDRNRSKTLEDVTALYNVTFTDAGQTLNRRQAERLIQYTCLGHTGRQDPLVQFMTDKICQAPIETMKLHVRWMSLPKTKSLCSLISKETLTELDLNFTTGPPDDFTTIVPKEWSLLMGALKTAKGLRDLKLCVRADNSTANLTTLRDTLVSMMSKVPMTKLDRLEITAQKNRRDVGMDVAKTFDLTPVVTNLLQHTQVKQLRLDPFPIEPKPFLEALRHNTYLEQCALMLHPSNPSDGDDDDVNDEERVSNVMETLIDLLHNENTTLTRMDWLNQPFVAKSPWKPTVDYLLALNACGRHIARNPKSSVKDVLDLLDGPSLYYRTNLGRKNTQREFDFVYGLLRENPNNWIPNNVHCGVVSQGVNKKRKQRKAPPRAPPRTKLRRSGRVRVHSPKRNQHSSYRW
ncbi:expressed unknown protein [Seminavis robusta]|uniref:Uncharacterized protein n=1 Tax=Seminavis robusta TaxID=568900 RepID=A0A9N8F0Z4_9STRA|nr:expressed unknown protein [Seminavis robusta]|eukprot:Sro2212_g319270.1 n/a (548) ;mRNA; f:9397-11040